MKYTVKSKCGTWTLGLTNFGRSYSWCKRSSLALTKEEAEKLASWMYGVAVEL